MKKIIALVLIFNFQFSIFNSAQAQILWADYSDPDVCQGPDGDYWMTASSFQTTPGLPILHSKDLVNWDCVNFAVHKLEPEDVYNKVQHGKGVWAPSIRYHQGEYYIYWGDPDFGIFMVHSKDPRGQWSDPVWVLKAKGIIDTTPLWDEDGRCYMVNGWAGSRCGFNSVITIRELSADGTHVISEPRMVYDGLALGDHTIEGPKLYKQNGYYYILAPAGGVEQGWQVALRSKHIYGPYERKVVFNKDGIHQGGWISPLPTSPRGGETEGAFICFQDKGVYGRILHLLDVKMKDGWPMMTLSKQAPSLRGRAGREAEGFAWHSNYQDHYGFHGNGFTRVYGEYYDGDLSLWNVNNLYLKKFFGEIFRDTLRTTISAKADGQQSGFVIMGRDYCRIAVELKDGMFRVSQIIRKDADLGKTETDAQVLLLGTVKAKRVDAGANPIYQTSMQFAIECQQGGLCTISFSDNGKKWTACPPFQARQGKWIGAKYGVYSICAPGKERGYIDINE